jgi:hypothetical protein
MVLLGHDTMDDVFASAAILRDLGPHARRLMAQCVEEGQLTRKEVSAAATSLENAGFIFVRDEGDVFQPEFVLTPSLVGEEALEALDERSATAPTQ